MSDYLYHCHTIIICVPPASPGSGDIVKDMQNQVTANSVRIALLQQQNAKLQNSISKMIQAQKRPRPDPTLQVK